MSIIKLSNEILTQVVHRPTKSDKYECLLVSKTWHDIALVEYYKEVKLSGNSIEFIKSQLTLGSENSSQQFEYGKWTKTLTIGSDRQENSFGFRDDDDSDNNDGDDVLYRFGAAQFLSFLSCFPNITTINFEESVHGKYYMRILHDASSEYLQQIHNIAVDPSKPSRIASYYPTFYKYRQTLTHLSMKMMWIFSMLFMHAPNLIDFTFFSDHSINEQAEKRLERMMDKIKRSGTSPSSYNKYLKTLYIQIPVLARPHIKYITSCAPDQLEDLQIDMTEANFFEWIRNCGMEIVLKLANRMSAFKTSLIYTKKEDDRETTAASSTPIKLNDIYQIANAIKGNREHICSAHFSDSSGISIGVRDSATLSYSIQIENNFFAIGDDNGSTDTNITTIEPEITGEYTFSTDTIVDASASIPLKYIRYPLLNCPRATRIDINYCREFIVDESLKDSYITDIKCNRYIQNIVLWREKDYEDDELIYAELNLALA